MHDQTYLTGEFLWPSVCLFTIYVYKKNLVLCEDQFQPLSCFEVLIINVYDVVRTSIDHVTLKVKLSAYLCSIQYDMTQRVR